MHLDENMIFLFFFFRSHKTELFCFEMWKIKDFRILFLRDNLREIFFQQKLFIYLIKIINTSK